MTSILVNWDDARVKLTWKKDHQLPQAHLITSVHGFCFQNDQILLVNINNRGWDLPGGHLEKGETPEESFKREAFEEACIHGECTLLGYIIVDHNENPLWTETSPYPEVGYQPFYKMDIKTVSPFKEDFESTHRLFVNKNEIASYHHDWHILYQKAFECALK